MQGGSLDVGGTMQTVHNCVCATSWNDTNGYLRGQKFGINIVRVDVMVPCSSYNQAVENLRKCTVATHTYHSLKERFIF